MMKDLKILVVDDEDIIRDGICKKINRLFPDTQIVVSAADAFEALQMVREYHPHIVITDISMPEMDGLQFINIARNIYKDMKYVIVSGFQDFQYARSAINLGVEDYLVKPIENEILYEIIYNLEKKLEQEQQNKSLLSDLKKKAIENTEFYKNKYLTDLTVYNTSVDINSILNNLSAIGINFPQSCFTVLTIAMNTLVNNAVFPQREDFPLMRFSVRNIAEEILSEYGKAVAFENLKDPSQIIIVLNHAMFPDIQNDMTLKRLCGNLLHSLNKYLCLNVVIGIGSCCKDISSISSSCLDSYHAVLQRLVLGDNRVIDIRDIPDSKSITFILPDDKRLVFQNMISDGNTKNASENVDHIFEMLENNYVSYDNVKTVYIDLSMLLIRAVNDGGGRWEKVFSEDILSETCLNRYTSLDLLHAAMKDSITAVCNYLNGLRKTGGKKVIDEIKDFINHYYYTDINLSTLAAKYYHNPSYLSQLFKNESGVNFIDYVMQVRMAKALDLLKNTDFKVYQVGEMVGYSNARYFGELFLKFTHMTPAEFRKSTQE